MTKPSYRPILTRVAPSQSGLLRAAFLCVVVVTLLVLAAFGQVTAPHRLTAADAKDHIGQVATVCGNVVSTRYAASSKGQPTFLNLDKPYPNQIFTVVIWGSNRSKFRRPEEDYKGQRICVTGKIAEYRGTSEIVADDPTKIVTDK
jgi:DNA/RNA endonuclease YhcR with UshA esterase domain